MVLRGRIGLATARLGFGSSLHYLVTCDSHELLFLSEAVRGHYRPGERYEQHEMGAEHAGYLGWRSQGQARHAVALPEHFQKQNLGSTSLKEIPDTEL